MSRHRASTCADSLWINLWNASGSGGEPPVLIDHCLDCRKNEQGPLPGARTLVKRPQPRSRKCAGRKKGACTNSAPQAGAEGRRRRESTRPLDSAHRNEQHSPPNGGAGVGNSRNVPAGRKHPHKRSPCGHGQGASTDAVPGGAGRRLCLCLPFAGVERPLRATHLLTV